MVMADFNANPAARALYSIIVLLYGFRSKNAPLCLGGKGRKEVQSQDRISVLNWLNRLLFELFRTH